MQINKMIPKPGRTKAFYRWTIETPAAGWITTYNQVDYYYEIQGDTMYIKFQQTKGDRDWERNYTFIPDLATFWNAKSKLEKRIALKSKKGSVIKKIWFGHTGFYYGVCSCTKEILNIIYTNNIKKVIISGYSQGADLACELAAYLMTYLPSLIIKTYAFAPSAIVFILFCWNAWPLFKNINLIIARGDIVTDLVPWWFGFIYIGKIFRIGPWRFFHSEACHESFYYENYLPEVDHAEDKKAA